MGESALGLRLHFAVDQVGRRSVHAVDLVHLGRDGRKVGVDHLDRSVRNEAEIGQPEGWIEFHQSPGGRVVFLRHPEVPRTLEPTPDEPDVTQGLIESSRNRPASRLSFASDAGWTYIMWPA